MIDLNNVQSINLSQFPIQSNFHQDQSRIFSYIHVLYVNDTHEIQFCSANFIQNFFFQDQDQDYEQDQDFTMKFIGESYSLYAKVIHQIWCRSAKFL